MTQRQTATLTSKCMGAQGLREGPEPPLAHQALACTWAPNHEAPTHTHTHALQWIPRPIVPVTEGVVNAEVVGVGEAGTVREVDGMPVQLGVTDAVDVLDSEAVEVVEGVAPRDRLAVGVRDRDGVGLWEMGVDVRVAEGDDEGLAEVDAEGDTWQTVSVHSDHRGTAEGRHP